MVIQSSFMYMQLTENSSVIQGNAVQEDEKFVFNINIYIILNYDMISYCISLFQYNFNLENSHVVMYTH